MHSFNSYCNKKSLKQTSFNYNIMKSQLELNIKNLGI